ncbi:helix-turn-helix domain-containing protein [Brumimicrobium mesophilum]|uniref:helix-turn-helix domain-containing protein n=1 Tax=Brumimicrobium mesophilum TaxID=392717 RepID=UPI000D143B80|nr:helix-turn-helix domain-containing protein [Brumimicrobium mesophilum]
MNYKQSTLSSLLYVIFILWILCSSGLKDSSTAGNDFDSIYFHTTVTIAVNDIDRAHNIADSLFLNSSSKLKQVKALMLSSSLYQQNGDIGKSIFTAKEAYGIAKNNYLYEWQARISGFLSSQFRIMEMYEQSEIYLNEGIEFSKKIDNEEMSLLYQGLILQEKTFNYLANKEIDEAKKSVNEAEVNFNKLKNERSKDYFSLTNQELQGRVYIQSKEWKLAEFHLLKALDLSLKMSKDNFMIEGEIYSELGRAYYEQDKFDLAFEYLLKAEDLMKESKNLALEIEVYKTFSDYYNSLKEYENYVLYNEKYSIALKEFERKKRLSISQYIQLTKNQRDIHEKYKIVFIVLSILLSISIFCIIIYFRKRQKRDKLLFENVMKKAVVPEEVTTKVLEVIPQENSKDNGVDELKSIMAEDTEMLILNNLKKFEKGKDFLDKNISLSKLAVIVNTNSKYLSYVLNKHENLNFPSYINKLRIEHIIKKISGNKIYRNYKISYLAEETGFSSHTKFSQAFKSVTGLSPSVFLKEFEDQEINSTSSESKNVES